MDHLKAMPIGQMTRYDNEIQTTISIITLKEHEKKSINFDFGSKSRRTAELREAINQSARNGHEEKYASDR